MCFHERFYKEGLFSDQNILCYACIDTIQTFCDVHHLKIHRSQPHYIRHFLPFIVALSKSIINIKLQLLNERCYKNNMLY